MTLRKDIERAMFTETYNTRVANIADTIGATEEDVAKRIKTLDFKDYVELMRALRDVNGDVMRSILGLGEAYNMGGTLTPSQSKAQKAGIPMADPEEEINDNPMVNKQKKTQAMQRLGNKNLGGATAQQSAAAIDKAQQNKTLSPIERKAMAVQAANLDALATDPKTATQFRNLLNKLQQGRQK